MLAAEPGGGRELQRLWVQGARGGGGETEGRELGRKGVAAGGSRGGEARGPGRAGAARGEGAGGHSPPRGWKLGLPWAGASLLVSPCPVLSP